jgi:CubicO group peptidase (beta-lactamase class C family)
MVRHLLTHTGGWAGDFFRSTGSSDDALARYVADMADLPQLAPLGRHWSYNNAGFSLAGYLVEVVTGQRYEAAMQELVFEPLGLDRCFFDPGQVLTHRFAVGHRTVDGASRVSRPWPLERSSYPAGGIVCHVRDLLRYARFHLGDGTTPDGVRLLSVEAMVQMQAPQVAVRPGESWGLSWSVVDEIEGARQVRHGGGTNGQVSSLILFPQYDLALAVLTNADHGGQVTEAVRRWVLKAYLDLEASEPQARQAPEEELAEYVGSYPGFFANLDLGLLAGRLIGLMTYNRGFPNEEEPPPPTPPPATLDLCDTDRLLVLDGRMKGATLDVIRQPDGSIGWLRVSGRLHRRR